MVDEEYFQDPLTPWFSQDIFSFNATQRHGSSLVYLGPINSGTQFHAHAAAWNGLVFGEKRWVCVGARQRKIDSGLCCDSCLFVVFNGCLRQIHRILRHRVQRNDTNGTMDRTILSTRPKSHSGMRTKAGRRGIHSERIFARCHQHKGLCWNRQSGLNLVLVPSPPFVGVRARQEWPIAHNACMHTIVA